MSTIPSISSRSRLATFSTFFKNALCTSRRSKCNAGSNTLHLKYKPGLNSYQRRSCTQSSTMHANATNKRCGTHEHSNKRLASGSNFHTADSTHYRSVLGLGSCPVPKQESPVSRQKVQILQRTVSSFTSSPFLLNTQPLTELAPLRTSGTSGSRCIQPYRRGSLQASDFNAIYLLPQKASGRGNCRLAEAPPAKLSMAD